MVFREGYGKEGFWDWFGILLFYRARLGEAFLVSGGESWERRGIRDVFLFFVFWFGWYRWRGRGEEIWVSFLMHLKKV